MIGVEDGAKARRNSSGCNLSGSTAEEEVGHFQK